MFVLRSGSHYIARLGSSYAVTSYRSQAIQFPTANHASSTLVKLPKHLYKDHTWSVEDLDAPQTTETDDYNVDEEATVVTDEIETPEDLLPLYDALSEVCEDYDKYVAPLRARLSQLDLEISDVYHYIECEQPLNVVNGYNVYKMLRGILLERRYVKHQLLILHNISESVNSDRMISLNNNFHNQRYKPRRLLGLFKTH